VENSNDGLDPGLINPVSNSNDRKVDVPQRADPKGRLLRKKENSRLKNRQRSFYSHEAANQWGEPWASGKRGGKKKQDSGEGPEKLLRERRRVT